MSPEVTQVLTVFLADLVQVQMRRPAANTLEEPPFRKAGKERALEVPETVVLTHCGYGTRQRQ